MGDLSFFTSMIGELTESIPKATTRKRRMWLISRRRLLLDLMADIDDLQLHLKHGDRIQVLIFLMDSDIVDEPVERGCHCSNARCSSGFNRQLNQLVWDCIQQNGGVNRYADELTRQLGMAGKSPVFSYLKKEVLRREGIGDEDEIESFDGEIPEQFQSEEYPFLAEFRSSFPDLGGSQISGETDSVGEMHNDVLSELMDRARSLIDCFLKEEPFWC